MSGRNQHKLNLDVDKMERFENPNKESNDETDRVKMLEAQLYTARMHRSEAWDEVKVARSGRKEAEKALGEIKKKYDDARTEADAAKKETAAAKKETATVKKEAEEKIKSLEAEVARLKNELAASESRAVVDEIPPSPAIEVPEQDVAVVEETQHEKETEKQRKESRNLKDGPKAKFIFLQGEAVYEAVRQKITTKKEVNGFFCSICPNLFNRSLIDVYDHVLKKHVKTKDADGDWYKFTNKLVGKIEGGKSGSKCPVCQDELMEMSTEEKKNHLSRCAEANLEVMRAILKKK